MYAVIHVHISCDHNHVPIASCIHPHLLTSSAGKAQRLKEAKEEAAKEIEEYRKQRDAQFQEKQQKYAGSKDDFAQKMQEETQKRIQQIEVQVNSNKEEVIKRLLDLVYDIKPELHQNIRLQQQKTK